MGRHAASSKDSDAGFGTRLRRGTTSGPDVGDPGLTHVFFKQLSIIGSTMGTRGELDQLVPLLDATGARPVIDRAIPMEDARDGFAAMAEGDVFGKIVFTR